MNHEEILTMEDKCFTCGKKQGINEPFIIFEPDGVNYHIAFCSNKCEKIYSRFIKEFNKRISRIAKKNYDKGFKDGKSLTQKEIQKKVFEEIEDLDKLLIIKQGCGADFEFYENDVQCGEDFEFGEEVKIILCPRCQAIAEKMEELKQSLQNIFNSNSQESVGKVVRVQEKEPSAGNTSPTTGHSANIGDSSLELRDKNVSLSAAGESPLNSGIKIIDVKVVGLCSKHRKEGDEIPRYKDGRIIPDEDIACIAEALGESPDAQTNCPLGETAPDFDKSPDAHPKRVRCIYCGNSIHISKFAGITKKGYVCSNSVCLMKLAQEVGR